MEKNLTGLLAAAFVLGALLGGTVGYVVGNAGQDATAADAPPGEEEMIERLTDEARELRDDLPKQVDAETQWFDVIVGPGLVSQYWYRLPNYNGAELNPEQFRKRIEPALTKQVCAEESMRRNMGYGTIYRFSYVGKDRLQIATIDVDRRKCGF